MRRLILALILVGLCLTPTAAQIVVTLSAPVTAVANGVVMRPARVEFNVLLGTVSVTMMEWSAGAFVANGRSVNVTYSPTTTPTGLSLIVAMNKANLSTAGNSLEQRIIIQLITNGFLAGATSGTVP